MATVTMRDMLEAGVHFGHQTQRWNPKMRPYIYGAKNGVYIINLQITSQLLRDALDFASRLGQKGDQILFVGTKRQAQEVVRQEAERCKQPYVAHRWLGGMLTNFRTIRTSLDRITEIEKKLSVGQVERLTKKEVIRFERELTKLTRNLGGVREMPKLPGAVFIVDTVKEHLALGEARRLGIPIIALSDTNSDPTHVDYPIPSNDDAIRAIRLFARAVADAYLEGASLHKDDLAREFSSSTSGEERDVDVVIRKADDSAAKADDAAASTEVAAEEAAEPSTDDAAEASAEAPAADA
ncbi:MAG: 30S ribosomal protein S2 [Deltaproteobacteria bacterium]|nr:30S ribosomal protein S2 [Deltaproteobacteria bacterium]